MSFFSFHFDGCKAVSPVFLLNDLERHNLIVPFLKEPILEIGVHYGKSLKTILDSGFEAEGTDKNPENVIYVDKEKVIKHDIENQKLDKKYNTILLLDVIEHLQCPNQAIKNVCEALNKNGKLIVSTPNILALKNRLWFLLGNGEYFKPHTENPHIRFFTPKTLDKTIEQNGFKKVSELNKGSITKIYEKR